MKISDEYKLTLILAGIFLVFLIIYSLRDILTPVFISWFIAYLIDPIADKLEKKFSRNVSVLIIVCFVVLVIGVILFFLIPLITAEIKRVSKNFPAYISTFKHFFSKYFPNFTISSSLITQINKYLPHILKKIPSLVGNINQIASGIFSIFLIPVFTFYFLRDFDKIRLSIFYKIPSKVRPAVERISKKLDNSISLFVRGQLLICLILGCLYSIGLAIVNIDLSVVVGFLAGFLNIIPYFGFICGILMGILMALVKYGDLIHITGVLIVFCSVQLLEGLVITPKILGNKVGLHPINVIVSLMVFGKIFGFIGLILAIPFASCIKVFYEELEERYRWKE